MNVSKSFFQIATALALTLAVALTAVANGNRATVIELECKVSPTNNGNKLVTITNRSDRVIAKGTQISFDQTTGVVTAKTLRSNLKPGRTQVVHLGKFDGENCLCRINRN
ncbi:MAG: hypothetical protein ACKVZH_16865 [Blastocatellia bacterium]